MSVTKSVEESRLSKVRTHDLAWPRDSRVDRFIGGGEHLQRQIRAVFHDIEEVAGHELVGLEIEDVDAPLGVLADLVEVRTPAAAAGR